MEKVCKKCKEPKDFNDFHKNESRCKSCMNSKGRNWKLRNKNKVKEYRKQYYKENIEMLSKKEKDRWKNDRENQTDRHRVWRHGVNKNELKTLKENSSGKCGICKRSFEKFHLDHDHKTGKIRDFLCRACNFGLGNFEDNPQFLELAIKYLQKHSQPKTEQIPDQYKMSFLSCP